MTLDFEVKETKDIYEDEPSVENGVILIVARSQKSSLKRVKDVYNDDFPAKGNDDQVSLLFACCTQILELILQKSPPRKTTRKGGGGRWRVVETCMTWSLAECIEDRVYLNGSCQYQPDGTCTGWRLLPSAAPVIPLHGLLDASCFYCQWPVQHTYSPS